MVKKNDGIKESTDSTNTIEEDGEFTPHWTSLYFFLFKPSVV